MVDPSRKSVKSKEGLRSFFLNVWPFSRPPKRQSRETPSAVLTPLARYCPVDDEEKLDALFLRLRRFVYSQFVSQSRGGGGRLLFEAGFVNPRRMFFYLKPITMSGVLFERNGAGWVLSLADRIPNRDMFVRKGPPLDTVILSAPASGEGSFRVSSQLFNVELLNFSSYEQRILHYLESRLLRQAQ